jgi:hypothetical protein
MRSIHARSIAPFLAVTAIAIATATATAAVHAADAPAPAAAPADAAASAPAPAAAPAVAAVAPAPAASAVWHQVCHREIPLGSQIPKTVCRNVDEKGNVEGSGLDDLRRAQGMSSGGTGK